MFSVWVCVGGSGKWKARKTTVSHTHSGWQQKSPGFVRNWNFSLETNCCTKKQMGQRKRQRTRKCTGQRKREAETTDKGAFKKRSMLPRRPVKCHTPSRFWEERSSIIPHSRHHTIPHTHKQICTHPSPTNMNRCRSLAHTLCIKRY